MQDMQEENKLKYVFLLYKETEKGVREIQTDVLGIYQSMDEAKEHMKNLSPTLAKDELLIISQIPMDVKISTHSDYVMAVDVKARKSLPCPI